VGRCATFSALVVYKPFQFSILLQKGTQAVVGTPSMFCIAFTAAAAVLKEQ
jgi:hypothetical protein